MEIWIAIFITLVVAGSILWIKPSIRDKKLTSMRTKALSLGFKVRLLDMKLAAQLFPWLENYRSYVFYEKSVPVHLKPKSHKARIIRLSEDIHAHEIDQIDPLKLLLADKIGYDSLPESVEALVISASGISVLWSERNVNDDMQEIEMIDNFLNQCLQLAELWRAV